MLLENKVTYVNVTPTYICCLKIKQDIIKDKQRKQRHSLKLGKKSRESSKRNHYIIFPRVIIKSIIIIVNDINMSY